MEIVTGKNTESMDRRTLEALAAKHDDVLLDVGTGSGRFVYEAAKMMPGVLCIGVDAERRAMQTTAKRSRRKPERGGRPNALFALSAAESLPAELRGLAGRVTVNLPWGSLLEGLVKAEPETLASLRSAAAPGALLEILMSYDERYEPRMMAERRLPPLTPALLEETLPAKYGKLGIEVVEARIVDNQAVKAIPLDWGRALARGRRRDFYLLVARMPAEESAPSRDSLLLRCVQPEPAPGADGDIARFSARGHANLLATHEVSIEFTRDNALSREGDCIVGVGADFDPGALESLASYRKLHVSIRSGVVEETFVCGVNDAFLAEDEVVFRKSAHCSDRTLGIGSTKSAAQLSRLLVERLRHPAATARVTITPIK